MIKIFILIERILDVFFLPIISPPDYRPTQKPLRNCISPGLITEILRYVTVCLAYVREAWNLHVKINSKAQNKKREWRQKVD